MAPNNDQTRKWLGFFPTFSDSVVFQPLAHLRTPFFAAILLSCVWGSFIVANASKLSHEFDAATTGTTFQEPTATSRAAFNLSAATTLNLFGKLVVKPADIDATTLPDTAANLKLVGLFTSTLPGASRSLIAEQGKAAKTYVEGDNLPGNITLFRIESDWVIVQRGDQFEKLSLHAGEALAKATAPLHSFAEMAQMQTKNAIASTPPTISKNDGDKAEGPQAIYRSLDASLAALQKKKS